LRSAGIKHQGEFVDNQSVGLNTFDKKIW